MLIFLTYLLISIIYTFPLILRLGNFLPGGEGDAYVYLWNIGNFWNHIFNNQNIFYSLNVMYPIGANLFFHTYAPLVSIVLFPFLKNISFGMGILIISAVALAAFSSYLFFFKLTQKKLPSFISGLIYGFSPIIYSFIQSQHYYFLFSAIFYPLGLLQSIEYLEKRRNRNLFFVLGIFWCILAIDYYSTILYALMISIFILFNDKLDLKKIVKYAASIFLAIVVPFLIIYLSQSTFREFTKFKQGFSPSASCNTNIVGFVRPASQNPFLGELTRNISLFQKFEINYDTPTYFLGWGILAFFIYGTFKIGGTKYGKSIIGIFLAFTLLSMGTSIRYGDLVLLSDKFTPFHYLLKIPILQAIDCPIRFPIITQVALAATISLLLSKLKKYKLAAYILLILVFFEYSVINNNFSKTEIPKIYKLLGQEENKKTLLELPSGISESKGAFGYDWSISALHSKQMYWQTEHQKPRVGVYMSRLTQDANTFFRKEPVISDLFEMVNADNDWDIKKYSLSEIDYFIKKFNLGYIILSPNDDKDKFAAIIENTFGSRIVKWIESEGFLLYYIN